jgi:hypothetical protein
MNRSDERKEFFFDIFVTALEGGIDYWACASEYYLGKDREYDLDGFYALVSDSEEDDTFPDNSRIDLNVIVKGLNKIINDDTVKINSEIRRTIRQASIANDAGLIDADAADCIIQVGLLGELVFG